MREIAELYLRDFLDRSSAKPCDVPSKTVRTSASIDWTKRESTRAGMRRAVRQALRNRQFPKESLAAITQLIIDQAATWGDRWAA